MGDARLWSQTGYGKACTPCVIPLGNPATLDTNHQLLITNYQSPGFAPRPPVAPPAGPDSADPHRAPGNAFKPYTFNAF